MFSISPKLFYRLCHCALKYIGTRISPTPIKHHATLIQHVVDAHESVVSNTTRQHVWAFGIRFWAIDNMMDLLWHGLSMDYYSFKNHVDYLYQRNIWYNNNYGYSLIFPPCGFGVSRIGPLPSSAGGKSPPKGTFCLPCGFGMRKGPLSSPAGGTSPPMETLPVGGMRKE